MTAEEVTPEPGDHDDGPADEGGPRADARDRPADRRQGLDRTSGRRRDAREGLGRRYWRWGSSATWTRPTAPWATCCLAIQGSKDYLAAKGQAFLEAYSPAQQEGRRQAARDLIVRQATRRFGADAEAAAVIAAIVGAERLRRLTDLRVLTAPDWASLAARA